MNQERAIDSIDCNRALDQGQKYQSRSNLISRSTISLLGLAGFLLAWVTCWTLSLRGTTSLIAFMLAVASPMVLAEAVNCRAVVLSSPIRSFDFGRIAKKLIGLAGTLGLITFTYWFIPGYEASKYLPAWDLLNAAFPLLVLTAPLYFVWMDRRMEDPSDGYLAMGMFFMVKWSAINGKELKAHVLSWTIKAFFFPLMVSSAASLIDKLISAGFNVGQFSALYISAATLLFAIDVIFGSIGYLCTLRVLGSHIRSVDETWTGWAFALMCYPPFSALGTSLFVYKGEVDWATWLYPYSIFYISWGFLILVLLVGYVWATISFGVGFSNLTNRGIITSGPYRYFKHPAYLSKNLAWWLMAVPFVAHATLWQCIVACVSLLFINGIYVVRALTEERHLMKDPDYQAYSVQIRSDGAWARVRRMMVCSQRGSIWAGSSDSSSS
jgi:protein-S-isoprenylcysteine O-methyltransferase Ste14